MAHRLATTPRTTMQVHTRLFQADVSELKKRARELGLPWQALLRRIVHEALLKEGKIQ